jgi:hypothetical protein
MNMEQSMKAREGYVIYDERRKRYLARVTAFDPVTTAGRISV